MRSHLTVKIFLITTLLFLAVSAVTYGFIIMYVPRYYIIEAEKMSVNSVQNDSEKNDAEHNIQYGGISNDKIISFRTEVNSPYTFEIRENAREFSATLHKVFLPLLAVAICTALVTSLFYSRYITRPVLRITEVSKKLAALDFGVQCREKRTDEIGMLAGNLNELSGRLSAALDELKNANAMLLEDVAREKELESRQLAFFSAVSHELKTPITILKGQLQGMLYHVGGYKDRDKYLKRSFEITCSMEQLVMEILTVTRMKASGFTAQIETFDLPALISGILEDFADLFSEKNMDIITEMEPRRMISADRRLFAKVIGNLISNAYHYSPAGEKSIFGWRIRTRACSLRLRIPESIYRSRRLRTCLKRSQEGSSPGTGKPEAAVWDLPSYAWCWNSINSPMPWKIRRTACGFAFYFRVGPMRHETDCILN